MLAMFCVILVIGTAIGWWSYWRLVQRESEYVKFV